MEVRGQRHAPAALNTRGKDTPVPIVQEAGWASELVWTQRVKKKQSRYTPWRRWGGQEVELILIHDLGTRWG
jgi:hypothetical protein